MTAQQLADKIGVVKTTVTRYETGDIEKIPYMTFLKILIALETTPEELLGEEEKELVQKSDELRGLFKVMGEVQQEMVKELADLSPEEAQYMRDVLKGLPKLRKQ
jgi:transcriptional regulator with XRE-family HTH domain